MGATMTLDEFQVAWGAKPGKDFGDWPSQQSSAARAAILEKFHPSLPTDSEDHDYPYIGFITDFNSCIDGPVEAKLASLATFAAKARSATGNNATAETTAFLYCALATKI